MKRTITRTSPSESDDADDRGEPRNPTGADPFRGKFPFWGRPGAPEPQPERIRSDRGRKAAM